MDHENSDANSAPSTGGGEPHGRVIQPLTPMAALPTESEPKPAPKPESPAQNIQPVAESIAAETVEAAQPVSAAAPIRVGIPKSVWITVALMIALPLIVAILRNILYESSIGGSRLTVGQTVGDTFVLIDIMVQSTLLSFTAPSVLGIHDVALGGFMHSQWFVWAVIGLCVVAGVYMLTRLPFARVVGIIGCWAAAVFNFFVSIRMIVLLMQTTPAGSTSASSEFVGYGIGYAAVFAVIGVILAARAARLNESSAKTALDQKVVVV